MQITNPANGATVSGIVTVKVTAAGIQRVSFYVDGVLKGRDPSDPFEFTWYTTKYPDGEHTIKAVSGNGKYSASVTVTVANGVTPSPSPSANPVPPPASGIYMGAYSGSWDWNGFASQAGKSVKLAMFGVPSLFTATNDLGNLKGGLAAADQEGMVGVVDCMTSQTGTLADFAAGKYDQGIDNVAVACQAFGKPLVLRIDAEMNGGWYDFGQEIRASAAGPANFVAACSGS